ncbi:lysophospholipid acyltransferase family protein [Shimia ponticola]|uniref:lysophospholipid acyltransferase family protein n=1 Tax=Shimia ponticola TaxID=2582893 RepID=UPI0011BD80AA|nr:lauroyl acyltransferase [Shimia ponticola]
MKQDPIPFDAGHWAENAALVTAISVLRLLPYRARLNAMSWIARRILGPLAGYSSRAMENLARIYPDLPASEHRRITDGALDSFGRSVIENYSPEFRDTIARHTLEGDGVAPALEALENGQAIIFSSGHYSNHEATRTALDQAGFDVAAFFRPMKNAYVDRHYRETLAKVSGPLIPQGKAGNVALARHLKKGGQVFLLHDVHLDKGHDFTFLGHPVKQTFSPAELALRYNALLVPYFGTRKPDGISFKLELEAPIPHGAPEDMMRDLVGRLERRIEQDPTQWHWIHRRWKQKRKKKKKA